jgi:hypothetical protein
MPPAVLQEFVQRSAIHTANALPQLLSDVVQNEANVQLHSMLQDDHVE